jgi:hypothetical protein
MPIFSINNKILVQCKATHIRLIAFLCLWANATQEWGFCSLRFNQILCQIETNRINNHLL